MQHYNIFLFHNNEYYCLLMACSSSILYKRAIRKDQGERSAVAFPWAINNNCILHSLWYRISNKQNTRNITSNLILFSWITQVILHRSLSARWQWTCNKPANNANITIEIGKQISKFAWTLYYYCRDLVFMLQKAGSSSAAKEEKEPSTAAAMVAQQSISVSR